MTIIKDSSIEKDLVDYCFDKWGRASGWHRCPTSSLFTRDDIRGRAYQGCYRAIREYDPTKLTKKSQPVNLKSWCIIVMRSHVNTCRRPNIWLRENILNCDFAEHETRNYFLSSVPNTDSLYEILVCLVREGLKQKSREHFIAFIFRIIYDFGFEEIANIMRLEMDRLMQIFKEIVPIVRFYGRNYCNYYLTL